MDFHTGLGLAAFGTIVAETNSQKSEFAARFVRSLTACQRELYTYINTLLAGSSAAEDVLQNTNLDLWARMESYDESRPFLPWAYSFAYQRIRDYRKRVGRSRLVFSDEMVQSISNVYMNSEVTTDSRTAALLGCLDKLSSRHAALIRERYMDSLSVSTLAQRMGCSVHQISSRLYRIRKILAKCIAANTSVEAG